MALVIKGSSSGQVTVDVPAAAGTNTLTIPASTGTLLTTSNQSTNTPAFIVSANASTALSETTNTKVAFNTEILDTDGAFDTSTYRFTVPSGKGGTYMISAFGRIDSAANSNLNISQFNIYLNGSATTRTYNYFNNNPVRAISHNATTILDLSAGDYVEMYAYINSVDNTGGIVNSASYGRFCGHKLIT
jgi:hypothetical protein